MPTRPQAITDSVLLKISHTGRNWRGYEVHGDGSAITVQPGLIGGEVSKRASCEAGGKVRRANAEGAAGRQQHHHGTAAASNREGGVQRHATLLNACLLQLLPAQQHMLSQPA